MTILNDSLKKRIEKEKKSKRKELRNNSMSNELGIMHEMIHLWLSIKLKDNCWLDDTKLCAVCRHRHWHILP